jgi:hypothetical protein
MIHPTNQVNRFIAIDAQRHRLVMGGLKKQKPPPIVTPTRTW